VLAGGLGLVAILYSLRIVTRTRDWRDDVTLYTRTLAVSPDSYHIRNNLGVVYWAQGRDSEAEREWNEALRFSPRHAIILNNLGLLRAKQKRHEEAIDLFRRAMRSKPNYTGPHLNLGTTFLEMGRMAEAELQLRAAVALSPLKTDARNKLGKIYLDSGRLEEAEEQYRRSAESQQNWTAYYGLGEVFRRRNASAHAEQAYRRAAELNPEESQVHFALGALYSAAGRSREALEEYQAGLTTDPHNAEALVAIKQLQGR
jgi:tetratricopeptide (TPR) repeat protein